MSFGQGNCCPFKMKCALFNGMVELDMVFLIEICCQYCVCESVKNKSWIFFNS